MLYAIYFYKVNLTQKDIYSIENTLRRYSGKYPHVSYLLTISNTDSSHCAQRDIKIKGKKGRPKSVVLGHKVPTHVHLCVIGNEECSAYKCIRALIKAFNKRFKAKICSFSSKGKCQWAKNFIDYSLRQANSVSKNGIFNEILEKKNITKSKYF